MVEMNDLSIFFKYMGIFKNINFSRLSLIVGFSTYMFGCLEAPPPQATSKPIAKQEARRVKKQIISLINRILVNSIVVTKYALLSH